MTMYRIGGRNLTPDEIKKEVAVHGRIRTAAEIRIESSQLEMKRIGRMLLSSEDGKLLMDLLEDMYDGDEMVAETTEKTYLNLGARVVVRLLRGLRDQAKEQ